MSRPFKSFSDFKANLKLGFHKTISKPFWPINFSESLHKVWSTAFRSPTLLLEPKFLSVFQKQEEDFTRDLDLINQAGHIREQSSATVIKKKKADYFYQSGNFDKIKKACLAVNSLLLIWQQKFQMVTPSVAADLLPHNTSSGFPDYVTPKSQIQHIVVNQATEALYSGDCSWSKYLTTMAWRTQVRPSGIKFRIIWVTSFLSQVFEMCFFAPFQKHFSEHKQTPYCFGNTWLDLKERIIKIRNFKTIVVVDFSSFDQSISVELIELFFLNIKQSLKINSSIWDAQFTAVKDFNCIGYVFNMFNNLPTIFRKSGSISSGSVFTNFMGSWINLFLICLYLIEIGQDPYKQCLNVMGDDCMFGFTFDFDIKHYSEWLFNNFGMTVNPEKSQMYSNDFETIEFLGSKLNEHGRFIDEDLAVRQLIISSHFIPERVMPENVRLISKLASISFKFSDGHFFFDKCIEKLLPLLEVSSLPEAYFELFYSAAGPFDIYLQRNLMSYKYDGWMYQ